jgi:hypothetical protein
MLKFLSVYYVIKTTGARWVGKWPNDRYIEGKKEINIKCLGKNDTGVVIFGPGQEELIPLLTTHKDLKILYKSTKAYNDVHPGAPRNTVVVFELKDK